MVGNGPLYDLGDGAVAVVVLAVAVVGVVFVLVVALLETTFATARGRATVTLWVDDGVGRGGGWQQRWSETASATV